MCDEKVRKALRHKVQAVERVYDNGEQVYFKRDGDKATWRRPRQILGKIGSIYFIVHQGEVVRVAACRIVAVEEANKQMGMTGERDSTIPEEPLRSETKRTEGIEVEMSTR